MYTHVTCPLCKKDLELEKHWMKNEIDQELKAREKFLKMCKQRAIHEGVDKLPVVTEPASFYYNKLAEYGRDHYQYKQCANCKDPYFCGLKSCAAAIEEAQEKEKEKREAEEAKQKEEAKQEEKEEKKEEENEEKKEGSTDGEKKEEG